MTTNVILTKWMKFDKASDVIRARRDQMKGSYRNMHYLTVYDEDGDPMLQTDKTGNTIFLDIYWLPDTVRANLDPENNLKRYTHIPDIPKYYIVKGYIYYNKQVHIIYETSEYIMCRHMLKYAKDRKKYMQITGHRPPALGKSYDKYITYTVTPPDNHRPYEIYAISIDYQKLRARALKNVDLSKKTKKDELP